MTSAQGQENHPLVSVVMPVYCATPEHEAYLLEALESVAEQSFRDFEVILVDDVSPRDITPVLEGVDLPGLRVIRNENNLGHARSRNAGVLASQAEFIAFLDHDDLWDERKLESDIRELKQNPQAGMVFCGVRVFGPQTDRFSIDQSGIPRSPSYIWLLDHCNYVVTASAAVVRRDLFLEVGLFDPRYTTCDDFDAWLKIARRSPIVYYPEKLVGYRLHDLNANYTVDSLNDNRLLTSLLLSFWKTAAFSERILLIPRIAKKMLGRLYLSLMRRRRFRDW